jgi:hypothetical protein
MQEDETTVVPCCVELGIELEGFGRKREVRACVVFVFVLLPPTPHQKIQSTSRREGVECKVCKG